MKEIYVELDMMSFKEFQKQYGFDGANQLFFTEKIYEFSEPYTPKYKGIFIANVSIGIDYIHYLSPQALYLWNGKLMIDPITQKGAFYNPNYGFWSRPNTLKELTNVDLNYTDGPLRGAFWTDRMWADKSEEIVSMVQQYVNTRGKSG